MQDKPFLYELYYNKNNNNKPESFSSGVSKEIKLILSKINRFCKCHINVIMQIF